MKKITSTTTRTKVAKPLIVISTLRTVMTMIANAAVSQMEFTQKQDVQRVQ